MIKKQLFVLTLLVSLSGCGSDSIPTISEGEKNRPQPVLLNFAGSRSDTMNPGYPYNDVGRILSKRGWLVISVDLPAHGDDVIAPEPAGLDGWRYRHNKGVDFITDWTEKMKSVVTSLIDSKKAKPGQI